MTVTASGLVLYAGALLILFVTPGPVWVALLARSLSGGFAAEYDVSGVSDPYLQVKILQLLRLLSEGDAQVGDSISDILAQVAGMAPARPGDFAARKALAGPCEAIVPAGLSRAIAGRD